MNNRTLYSRTALHRLASVSNSKESIIQCALTVSEELEDLEYSLCSLLTISKEFSSRICPFTTKTIRDVWPILMKKSSAFSTTPDGNCFFNALAIHFNATEELACEYRLRTCIVMLLNPEKVCVVTELQFPIICSLFPLPKKQSILAAMLTSCFHGRQIDLTKVNCDNMQELRDRRSPDGSFFIMSPDEQVETSFEEGVLLAKEGSWACWRWIIGAAVALDLNLLVNFHSISIRANCFSKSVVPLYWNDNHFSALSLDCDAAATLAQIVKTAETKQENGWSFVPHECAQKIRLVCLCDEVGNYGIAPSLLTCPTSSEPRTLFPVQMDEEALGIDYNQLAQNSIMNPSDFAFMDIEEQLCEGFTGEKDTASGQSFATIVADEEQRVLGVVKELFRERLQSEEFSTAGFWSDSTINTIRAVTEALDKNLSLNGNQKKLLRSRQQMFYFGKVSPQNKRFRLDENGYLIFRFNLKDVTKEKRVVSFEDGFARMFKMHLSPSLTCLPKKAKRLAGDVLKEVHFPNAGILAENMKRICKGCQISCRLKTALPFVPKVMHAGEIMERLQIDLIDMAPDSELTFRSNFAEYRYVLSISEFLTRYCFLFPLRRKTGSEVRKVLQMFFIAEGQPKLLHSDNGKEFVNKMVDSLLEFGGAMIHGAPYKPTSQGQVERLNQKVKRVLAHLMANLDDVTKGLVWPFFIPSAQRILNTTVHESIGITPFEAFIGYQPLPNDAVVGIELDSLEMEPFHESCFNRLPPEGPEMDSDEQLTSLEQLENHAEEHEATINRNIEAIHALVEPMRSHAMVGLEELSYRRACMQATVIEQIERRLYRNVYKPALESRKVVIEKGDIFIWRPLNRRKPKSSLKIRAKIVRILEKRQTLPGTYKVEFYGAGDREPEMKTEDNKSLFTEVMVIGKELCFCRKGRDNIAKLMDTGISLSLCPAFTINFTKEEIVSAVSRFSERLREYFKEIRFLSKAIVKELPTDSEMERYFDILDQGVVEYMKELSSANASGLDNIFIQLQALRDEKQFGCWLSALRKWESATKSNCYKLQNKLLGRDVFHNGSCLECMAEKFDCEHVCCEQYLHKLCEKRGGQYLSIK